MVKLEGGFKRIYLKDMSKLASGPDFAEACTERGMQRQSGETQQHWSDDRWKSCLAAGGGSKRRYQYCSDNSGRILYLRALQGHSGNNLIDPTLQDNVVIGSGIFHFIYHVGCAFNLHSIINMD